jgi:hypothetical protein
MSRRYRSLVRCHLPPRALGTRRLSNSRAMSPKDTKPAFRSLRIIAAKAVARASAASLCASVLLILPLPGVTRPRRVSSLTVVGCHLPPWGANTPLRFNSFASPRWEMRPAAISSRMVGSKARARDSAALLPATPPRIPRLRDEVFPYRSIGQSWPHF